MEVIDSEFSRQYQAKINGELAFVDYAIQERKIFFTKTLLPESANEALIDEFFRGVLELVAQKKYRVVPVCTVAIALFKRNKEYKDVLPAGIRI